MEIDGHARGFVPFAEHDEIHIWRNPNIEEFVIDPVGLGGALRMQCNSNACGF
jgi:hypothetical protein